MKTKQLVLNAMLIAMCTVLASLAVQLGGNFKITFESIPVHIGALLAGPVNGAIIGGLGTLLYQLFFSGYGITATTLLWILPYVVCGVVVGSFAKWHNYELSRRQLVFIMLIAEFCILALNTVALYIDSKLYGYYSAAFVFGTLGVRLLLATVKGVAYSAILPALVKALKAATHSDKGEA